MVEVAVLQNVTNFLSRHSGALFAHVFTNVSLLGKKKHVEKSGTPDLSEKRAMKWIMRGGRTAKTS